MITKILLLLVLVGSICAVSHWSFDDCAAVDITDSSAGRNGAVVAPGGSSFQTTEGYLLSAIFVSNGAFVSVSFPTISAFRYSFALWVKPSATVNMEMLAAEFLQGPTSPAQTYVILGVDSQGRYIFGRWVLNTFDGVRSASGNIAKVGTWAHIAGVWGAPTSPGFFTGVYYIYVDGLLQSSLNSFLPAPNVASQLNQLWIGKGPIQSFHGVIDEVWFWEYEIDAHTIATLANQVAASAGCAGLPPPVPVGFTPTPVPSPSLQPQVPPSEPSPAPSFRPLFPGHPSPSPRP